MNLEAYEEKVQEFCNETGTVSLNPESYPTADRCDVCGAVIPEQCYRSVLIKVGYDPAVEHANACGDCIQLIVNAELPAE